MKKRKPVSYTHLDVYKRQAYTDKGGCFSTYAYRLIWHEISDALIRANRLGDREILLSTYNYEAQEDAHFSSFSESLEIENAISNAETSATEIIQKGIQALRMSTDGYNSYEIGEVLHTSPGTVSYTHLDVYKRQSWYRK